VLVLAAGHLGPDAKEAAPAVVELIDHNQFPSSLETEVLNSLRAIGADTPGVPERLSKSILNQGGLNQHICRLLKELGPRAKPAMNSLLTDLKERPTGLSAPMVMDLLASIGDRNPEVLDAVRTAAEKYPREASAALWRLGERDPDLLTAVVKAPESRELRDFTDWAEILAAVGPDAKAAAPVLEQVLLIEDEFARVKFAQALVAVDPSKAEVCAEALIRGRSTDEAYVMPVLADLGAASPAVISHISSRLTSKDETLRAKAAIALVRLAPDRLESARSVIESILDDPDPLKAREKGIVVEGLATIGEPARDVLTKASRNPDPLVRLTATRAIRGLDAKSALQ
jgi:hypothetical protein